MRNNVMALIACLCTLSLAAQRITFDDPDLSFSFKKPKGWRVFDDSYVVKVSPSISDTATLFFSFTYFEEPSARQVFDVFEENTIVRPSKPIKVKLKQLKRVRTVRNDLVQDRYVFQRLGQTFEIVTSCYNGDGHHTTFKNIIQSIVIY